MVREETKNPTVTPTEVPGFKQEKKSDPQRPEPQLPRRKSLWNFDSNDRRLNVLPNVLHQLQDLNVTIISRLYPSQHLRPFAYSKSLKAS